MVLDFHKTVSLDSGINLVTYAYLHKTTPLDKLNITDHILAKIIYFIVNDSVEIQITVQSRNAH